MSGMGHQDGVEHPGGPAPRSPDPYIAPPHIRTTGEVPAVTGEIPAAHLPRPSGDEPVDPTELGDRWPAGGSVVDRPPPAPPDWMSGVQVPELLVTREIDPARVGQAAQSGFVGTAQRVIGLVLVAILVAVVVLVIASSVLGL